MYRWSIYPLRLLLCAALFWALTEFAVSSFVLTDPLPRRHASSSSLSFVVQRSQRRQQQQPQEQQGEAARQRLCPCRRRLYLVNQDDPDENRDINYDNKGVSNSSGRFDDIIAELRDVNSMLVSRIDSLENKIENVTTENINLKEQMVIYDQKIENVTTENGNLKEQMAMMRVENGNLKELMAMMRVENGNLKEQMVMMNDRLDGIVRVFTPAVKHALLETAVYEFFNCTSGTTNVAYGKSRLAHNILTIMIVGLNGKNFDDFYGSRLKVDDMVLVLQAVLSFVTRVPTKVLIGWPPEERNIVAHNGPFLDALYNPMIFNESQNNTITQEELTAIRNGFIMDKPSQKSTASVEVMVNKIFDMLQKLHMSIPVNKNQTEVTSFIDIKTLK